MPDGGQLVARTRVTRQGVALDLIDTGCGMDERTAMKMFDAFYTHQERRQRPRPAHRPPDHRSPRRPHRRPQRSRPRHAVHAGVSDAGADWGVRGSAECGLRIADCRQRYARYCVQYVVLGTEYLVLGPISRGPEATSLSSNTCPTNDPPTLPSRPRRRSACLIVDNDEALARAMEESLAKVGYECVVATSGPEGARQDRDRHVRHRRHRPGDERRRWHGDSGPRPPGAARRRGDPGHRPRHRPQSGRGDAAGGVQLPRKADHAQPAAGRLRKGGRRHPPQAAEHRAARAARRAVRLRGDHLSPAARCRR